MDRKQVIDTLEDLSAKMIASDPGEKETLLEVGINLEKIIAAVPSDCSDGQEVLALTLRVMQELYQESIADAEAATGALAEAMSFLAELLREDEMEPSVSKEEMLSKLACVLGEKAPQATAGEPGQEPQVEAQESPSGEPVADSAPKAQENILASLSTILPEDSDMDLLKEFCVECLDHITSSEGALLDLEANSDDPEPINVVFRAFHTIKGTSGFLGLDVIQKVAHLAENLLDRARDGEIHIVGGYADLALRSSDALKLMIQGLEGSTPGQELSIPDDLEELLGVLADPEAAGVGEDDLAEPMRVGDILVAQAKVNREDVEAAAKQQGNKPIGQELVDEGKAKATDVAQAIRAQKRMANAPKTAGEASIRVSTDRLDNLMNMVGELVIAQSMVAQDPFVAGGENPRLARNVSHAGKIIRELQDLTMSLRMVPLKATFQKMARLVRDLGRKSGKQVQFTCEGEDTEIDRSMVEVLNDPLVHMIRNACDHGVESPEDRAAAGKNPTGNVTLRAYHSAGNVVIELQDDGKGLDRDKILAKALDRGLVDHGRELSDSEVFMQIFQPGFSTAEKVTDVSGRGVGMDVVKKSIDSIRGRIETTSKLGHGTTFSLRLPLTTAIADAMLLQVGKQHYLLPTISIEQSFKPEPEAISTIKGQGEVVMLRGDLLPIFRLHKLFDVPEAITDVNEGLLIVIEGEGKRCALMVDELLGQQQVVIKSLGEMLGHIPGVSGGAILGDGRVGLILDAVGLVHMINSKGDSLEAAA